MRYQRHSDGQVVDGYPHRFGPDMFRTLEAFLDGKTVVSLRDLARDDATDVFKRNTNDVGMRHDVDHNLEHAVKFARWEHARGWRSTYFVLHTAWYFDYSDVFWNQLLELEHLGHEIGLHTNAVAKALDDGPDPGYRRARDMIRNALETLNEFLTTDIVGTAAHGDHRCDLYHVHNNDLWEEQGGPFQLHYLGLEYEAYFLHRPNWYISDSGGRWEPPLPLTHHDTKQTSMLIHPCHWDIDAERHVPA